MSIFLGCGEKDNGIRPNPFEDGDTPGKLMNVEYTSNADTVFLNWELLTDKVDFDNYQITSSKTDKVVVVAKDKKGGYITRVPYNELVDINISFIKSGKEVEKVTKNVTIDGLDKTFAALLIPDRGSVTGGDGTYSIALPDGRSIFMMGDSFIGPVTNGERSMSDHMFRNTYIVYDDGKVSAIYGTNGDKSSAAVPPGVTDEHQKWYWPGHGFVKNNKLYIFQTLMFQGAEGMWGFMYETTDILEYSLPEIELLSTTTIPFKGSTDIHYGMAALEDGDYIYVYAQEDVENSFEPISDALVARTTIEDLYTNWEYFDGTNWSQNSVDGVKMAGLSSIAISSQFNVFKLEDKYVLLSQHKRFNSGEIYTFIADNPQGPWYNRQLVYKIPKHENPKVFTYNAMAHPQFTKDGMILICYNINNEDFADQHRDVSTYRPKFMWIDINKILGK
ncbi:MAG: DUF5005 domain-containing protein [Fermentimonas sp.]|nr:DUF5005 domain-containing protein [Fermentimonas sp.]